MRNMINPGISLMLLVALFQSIMATIVKTIEPNITTGVQVLAYYIVPLLFLLPMLARSGGNLLKTDRLFFFFLRSALASGAVFCFFYAASHIHLGVAAVLFNTTPIFIPLLASVFLKEHTSRQVYLGIICSLVGVIIVIHPGVDGFFTPISIIGVCSGFLMAVAQVMLRHLAKQKVAINQIVFYLYLMASIFTLLIIGAESLFVQGAIIKITGHANYIFVFGMLVLLGVISLVAQRSLTKAFYFMPAAKLAPYLYVSVPVSSLIGWFFWQQGLGVSFYVGAVFVLLGVLLVTFDNKQEKK